MCIDSCVCECFCTIVPLHFRRSQFALRLALDAAVSGSPLKVLVLVLCFSLCYFVYGCRTNGCQSVNGLFSLLRLRLLTFWTRTWDLLHCWPPDSRAWSVKHTGWAPVLYTAIHTPSFQRPPMSRANSLYQEISCQLSEGTARWEQAHSPLARVNAFCCVFYHTARMCVCV
jgi:hypothetical protein